MKNEIGLGVSAQIFADRFKSQITEDVYTNQYHNGEFRGKIKGNKFYFYISEDKPKTFTTVLKGTLDERDANYNFSKLMYTKILMIIASLLWLSFAFVMASMMGPRGFIALLVIPVMLIPFFLKKKSEKKALEDKLTRLCKR